MRIHADLDPDPDPKHWFTLKVHERLIGSKYRQVFSIFSILRIQFLNASFLVGITKKRKEIFAFVFFNAEFCSFNVFSHKTLKCCVFVVVEQ